PVLQHRHQLLRIERREALAVLLAAAADQVHRRDVVLQALEVQADAHAIGRARTPVRVQAERARAAVAAVAAGAGAGFRCFLDPHRPSPSVPRPPGAQGAGWCSMRWSIAPKMERPSRSNISMRTRSPNDRNGVFGAPCSSASTVRLSA